MLRSLKIQRLFIWLILLLVLEHTGHYLLRGGLRRFFGFEQKAKILLIGHSQLMLAIDQRRLQGELRVPVAKYCMAGVDLQERFLMLEHFLKKGNNAELELVVMGVDCYSYNKDDLGSNAYMLFVPFMDETNELFKYIEKNASCMRRVIYVVFPLSRYSTFHLNTSMRGYLGRFDNFKNGMVNVQAIKKDLAVHPQRRRKITMGDEMSIYLKKAISLCEKNNLKVILVNTPVMDVYTSYQREEQNTVFLSLKKISTEFANCRFTDLNQPFASRYELFYDPIHINAVGQPIVTSFFVKSLREFFPVFP